MGCYGYLTRAHIQSQLAGQIDVENHATPVAQQIENGTAIVADLNRRIGQIDSAVDEATRRGRTKGAMDLAAQQTVRAPIYWRSGRSSRRSLPICASGSPPSTPSASA